MPTRPEPVILQEALDALRLKTGLQAKVLPTPKVRAKFQPDALIEIEFNGQKQHFVAEIKGLSLNPVFTRKAFSASWRITGSSRGGVMGLNVHYITLFTLREHNKIMNRTMPSALDPWR